MKTFSQFYVVAVQRELDEALIAWLKQWLPGHENDIYPTPEDALKHAIENGSADLKQQLYRRTIERDEAAALAKHLEDVLGDLIRG